MHTIDGIELFELTWWLHGIPKLKYTIRTPTQAKIGATKTGRVSITGEVAWMDGWMDILPVDSRCLDDSLQGYHKRNSWEELKFVGETGRRNKVVVSARTERVL